jgi:predicted CXXCH cytochrome family protein
VLQRLALPLIAVALVALAGFGCEPSTAPAPTETAAAPTRDETEAAPAAAYVGGARCAECHPAETALWQGSHHDAAMMEANAETVLGAFDGRSLDHFGQVSTFLERDGRYFVNTAGPDGEIRDFEILYTFGVAPLQQYLVQLPGGRLQALTTAWDARPAAQGGQRWYHLNADEPIPVGDVLHWTQLSQRWNAQCAECHSTDLRKGFDAAAGTYDTQWEELDVSCEACHGPGSTHATWAENEPREGDPGLIVHFEPFREGRWRFEGEQPIARRSEPLASHVEIETCAPCHSRRSTLREGRLPGEPLLDTHRPALLAAGLYEADGQIRDEVYVWGSFLQSRMYAAGVNCSDCHEPHSLALRAEGNALCGQCHQPAVYDQVSHHHHAADSPAAECVSCHLPVRTYMGVDDRRDHSFRVPRPDLSVSLGTPNACNDCHGDRPARWAAAAVTTWFPNGRSGTPHFAEAIDAGRRRAPGAAHALAAVALDARQAVLVRATALSLLDARTGDEAADAIGAGLGAREPLLRLGALEGARTLAPATRTALVTPLLDDPLLAVRLDAARTLSDVAAEHWSARERTRFAATLTELRSAFALDADRPESHVGVGLLALQQGDYDAARRAYESALEVAPWFVPAYVNLADLEQRSGNDAAGEAWLRRAIEVAPEIAEPHHALGLWLVRAQRGDEAEDALARAAELAPENARFAFAHVLIVDAAGSRPKALALAEAALARHAGDRDLRFAAASFAGSLGQREQALAHARVLAAEWPDDPQAKALLAELEKPTPAAPAP